MVDGGVNTQKVLFDTEAIFFSVDLLYQLHSFVPDNSPFRYKTLR